MGDAGQEALRRALEGVGASKTIYALVMPETEAIKRKVIAGEQRDEFVRTLQAISTVVDADGW